MVKLCCRPDGKGGSICLIYAPQGYTPLSMLWDQFVEARLDAIYRSASRTYQSKNTITGLIRGSPVDIAEYIFSHLMWKCRPHAASADGVAIRIHTRFQDGVPGLFTQIGPYRSCFDAVVAEMEQGSRDEIERVAGVTFEEWDFETEDADAWNMTYPPLADSAENLPDQQWDRLRYHTLPICFERERFTIVEKLPIWARTVLNNRDQEVLVDALGGKAICVPDERLEGWERILNGETPILEEEVAQSQPSKPRVGRPTKIPATIKIFQEVFPDGRDCSWSRALALVNARMDESVSMQTLKRAVEAVSLAQSSDHPEE